MEHIANDRFSYRYLPYLTTLLFTFSSVPILFVHRMVEMPWGVTFATALTAPFWYVIGDIITEVYGFKIFFRVFRMVLLCQILFIAISQCLIKLKSPGFGYIQTGYEIIFDSEFKITVIKLVLIYAAYVINAYLLDYWKIFLRGRFFWLRCIGASLVGYLLVVTILTVFASDFMPYNRNLSFIGSALIFKLISTAIVALPAILIVSAVQKAETKAAEYNYGLQSTKTN